MNTVILTVSIIGLIVVETIAFSKGLDLRKFSSWFYGAISFICGCAFDFSLGGSLNESLQVGAIFAFLTLIGGATMLRHKHKYEVMAKSLLLQYGKEDDQSLFATLVRTFLGKHK